MLFVLSLSPTLLFSLYRNYFGLQIQDILRHWASTSKDAFPSKYAVHTFN